jgi:uncharacterized protein YjbI with pentapeptide repeats
MTTPNTPAKKVPPVEILHLDESGYGYDGTYTRREWRAECLENFEAGADAFLAWQEKWKHLAEQSKLTANFEVLRTFEDGSQDKQDSPALEPSHCIDFSGHDFKDGIHRISTTGYQFLYKTNFRRATIRNALRIANATFADEAYFTQASFLGLVDFNGTTFAKKAYFGNATFAKVAFFNCTFIDDVYFSNTIFKGTANFTGSRFIGNAYFGKPIYLITEDLNKTTFEGRSFFDGADFKGDADFSTAIFEQDSSFVKTTFTGDADFSAVSFKKAAQYRKAQFNNQSLFQSAKFNGEADFENATFANVGHFEGATFDALTSKIPSFRGVDVSSTLLEFSNDKHFTQADFGEEAIKNIAFLKLLSEQHGQIDQALNFNAMELRAKRLQVIEQLKVKDLYWLESSFKCAYSGKWWASCPTTWLYDKVSDFGRSFMRPLVGFVAIYGIALSFAYCCAGVNNPQNCQDKQGREVWNLMLCDTNSNLVNEATLELNKADAKLPLNGYEAAFEYANYHATGLVDFTGDSKMKEAITQRMFGALVKPWWARLIGALFSLLNTVLLFLILLGLRNSYRLK